jgi:hypothetical protein
MKRPWLFGFLIVLLIVGLIEHDLLIKHWSAMFPSDPAQKTALQLCYIEDREFNRLSPASRTACYEKWLPILSYAAQHGGVSYER